MLRTALRVLDDRDSAEVLELCARDPVANVFVAARVHAVGADPRRLGGELWGWYDGTGDGALRSVCWAGANLAPVEATEEAIDAFAARARRQGRRSASIVGPAKPVLALWERLSSSWGPAFDIRENQPVLVLDGAPAVTADPLVRATAVSEIDLVLPACVAFFSEEMGYSPLASDGGASYRGRVAELVHAGRSFVRVDESAGRPAVLFKAELGAVTPQAVQVQSVWVRPDRRGEGLAAPAVAAVALAARREAPVVSLYVNSYNTAALATYARVGFRQVDTFATILF